MRDIEANTKRNIKELFLKPIIVTIDGIDMFEKMKKIRPIEKTWYDWLINYISRSIRKSVGGFKDKTISLFRRNTPKKLCIEEERN